MTTDTASVLPGMPAPVAATHRAPEVLNASAPITHPIAALRAVRTLLLTHDGLDAFQAAALVARAIDDWLMNGGDFAAVLGMAPGWHSALRQRERAAALRELADRYFPTLTGRALARALATAGRDYEARRWARNRAARHRPDGQDGLLHDIATHGGMPTEETLRKCIG